MASSTIYWSAIVLLLLLFVSSSSQQCLGEEDFVSTGDSVANVNILQNASSGFAFRLFKEIAKKKNHATANVLISPISVWAILVMACAGAHGQTSFELATLLHLDDLLRKHELIIPYAQFRDQLLHNATDEANYTFNLANKIFFNENLHIGQCIGNNTNLNAELQSLDFATHSEASRQLINHWVESETNNKIKDLVQPGQVRPLTTMFLVNAAYFRGLWKTEFELTFLKNFFVKPNKPIKVKMMKVTGRFRVADDDSLKCSALDLPYSGGEVSMIILLPNTNVEDVVSKLTSESMNNLWNSLTYHHFDINVPEFRVEQTIGLKSYIRYLGVTRMFGRGMADFSGFTGDRRSYVDSIRQKSYIDVNKKGTEAAASTVVRFMFLSAPFTDRKPFVCNKPFIYFIRHKRSGAILFSGIVRKP